MKILLGDGSSAIPAFPDIRFMEPLPDDCQFEDVDTLKSIYREHLETFLDAILSLEFSTVESLWREFWRYVTLVNIIENTLLTKAPYILDPSIIITAMNVKKKNIYQKRNCLPCVLWNRFSSSCVRWT